MTPPMTPACLAAEHDVLLLDLDGVVYVGPRAVPGAVEALAAVGDLGVRLAYVTNNASRTPAEVAEHLVELGLPATPDDVVTSAQAGARLLAERLPPGSPVLVVGGPGIAAALREIGLEPTDDPDLAHAVLQGFGRNVAWTDLAAACRALGRGVPWIATNLDLTIPLPEGIAPGNGLLVHAVAQASGRRPDDVAGKPYPPLMHESIARTGAAAPLIVGDRLDTDIEAATTLGLPSLLVLTGVSTPGDLVAAQPKQRPTALGVDLGALLEPPLPTPESRDGQWVCGAHAVRVADDRLHWAQPRSTSTDRGLAEAVWLVAHAVWATGADAEDVVADLVSGLRAALDARALR